MRKGKSNVPGIAAMVVLLSFGLILFGCDDGTTSSSGGGPASGGSTTATGTFWGPLDDDGDFILYFISKAYRIFPELADLDDDEMWFQRSSWFSEDVVYCQAIDGGWDWTRKSGYLNPTYPFEGTWEHTENDTGNVWTVTLSGTRIDEYTINMYGYEWTETGYIGSYTLSKEAPAVNNIPNAAIAKEFVEKARQSLIYMDNALPATFVAAEGTKYVYGSTGSAAANGQKTYSYTTSNGGSWYTQTANTNITYSLSNFSNDSSLTLTGNGTFYRGYSDVNHGVSVKELTIAYKLNSCRYKYTYGGTTYSGTVTIDYSAQKESRPNYTATVTFQGGQTFTITGIQPQ